jgi:hypothetical protein
MECRGKVSYFMLPSASILKPKLAGSATFISPGHAVAFIKPLKLYWVLQEYALRI